MKVCVVGGCGAMGSGIVRDLILNSEDIEKVLVCDRNIMMAKQLQRELSDDRILPQYLDAAESAALYEVLKDVDVCVNCVPTLLGLQIDIMRSALKAKCAYLDLGGLYHVTLKQKELSREFLEAGVPALLGMGSAPGCTNILAKYGADRLDKVDKIELFSAWKVLGPESPIFIPPYSIRTLLSEYSDESIQYVDGHARSFPALSGRKTIDFPEPIGKVECFFTLHSEPATLPSYFKEKGVREVTWRLGPPRVLDEVMKVLISVGFADTEPLKVNGVEVKPVDFLEVLIQRNIEKNKDKVPKSEEVLSYSVHRANVEGEVKGKKTKFTIDVIQDPDEIYKGYSDPLTSMSASIGAQMLGKGEIEPGVWAPEECIDPIKFFNELKKRKFKIRINVEEYY